MTRNGNHSLRKTMGAVMTAICLFPVSVFAMTDPSSGSVAQYYVAAEIPEELAEQEDEAEQMAPAADEEAPAPENDAAAEVPPEAVLTTAPETPAAPEVTETPAEATAVPEVTEEPHATEEAPHTPVAETEEQKGTEDGGAAATEAPAAETQPAETKATDETAAVTETTTPAETATPAPAAEDNTPSETESRTAENPEDTDAATGNEETISGEPESGTESLEAPAEETPAPEENDDSAEPETEQKQIEDMILRPGEALEADAENGRPFLVLLRGGNGSEMQVTLVSQKELQVTVKDAVVPGIRVTDADGRNRLMITLKLGRNEELLLSVTTTEGNAPGWFIISAMTGKVAPAEDETEAAETAGENGGAAAEDAVTTETAEAPQPEETETTDGTAEATEAEPETTDGAAATAEAEPETETAGRTEEQEATQTADEAPLTDPRVTLRRTLRKAYKTGEMIRMTAELDGTENMNEVLFIWEVNKGEGWEEAERETSGTYSCPANAETLGWDFRVRVLYR